MAEHSRKHPPIPVVVVVLVLILGGGAWWWSSAQSGNAATADALTGTVEANTYSVMSSLTGRITAVRVSEGDTVTAGQELVRLDRSALKLQVSQAHQGVVAAKAALTNARDDDDSTDADIDAARARLKQAEAAEKLARVQLGYTIIPAPHNGTVVSVTSNAGQNASPGKALLTLTDPTDLFVRVFVPETAVGGVRVGQPAHLTSDSTTGTFDGTVSFVASSSEFTPNDVQTKDQRTKLVYEVRVRVSDPSGALKAGMPVDAVLG